MFIKKLLQKITLKTAHQKQYPLLMTPGPVPVPEQIMGTLALPIIHHRTDAFESDLKKVLQKLPLVFKTKRPVFLHTSTGSGAMESAIVNTLSPNDVVLTIVCGKFGERWTEMAKAFGLNAIEYKLPWGESFKIEKIKEYFIQNPSIKAVLCQACETSTGALNPVQELGAFLKEKNCILIVDAITALGATQLNMDAWNLDVVLGGSQKAFMLPTGISMISFSEKAWKFTETSKLPKYYWDIRKEKKANEKGQTYFSSPVSIIRCLNTSLDIILKVGVDKFVERHEMIATALRAAGQKLGLKIFAENPSSTVTAFLLPENIDGEKIQKIMEEEFLITVAGGQDQYKGKIIRIGHMGAIELEHVEATLKALSMALSKLGLKTNSEMAIQEARKHLTSLKPLPQV